MSSLSTLHREYAALLALPYYDFYESILSPKLIGITHMKPDHIQKAMTDYKVNEPQAIAILNALRADGFVLIQGYALASHCLATTDLRSS
jgi:senataxin